jgi:hypothetical protein
VQRSELILRLLAAQVDDYRAGTYLNESRVQRVISDYELRRMQEQLLATARSEAQFLLAFNAQFEAITGREITALTLTQRYLLSRFTFKLRYLRALFAHPLLAELAPDAALLQDIISNAA